MAGLLDLLGGGGNTGGMDLNQLVRPPDPLGAALGEISQRLAVAGQASRLPVSTLGALGSALGGASTAAQTAQTQYLDQAIKLQALKRSLMQAGYDAKRAELFARWAVQSDPGTPAPVPGAPPAPVPGAPAAAPGTPGVSPSMVALPNVPNYSRAFGPAATAALPGDAGAGGEYGVGQSNIAPQAAPPGFTLSNLPPGSPGTVTIGGQTYTPPGAAPLKTAGLLGDGGGAGAAATPSPFRLASMVGPAGDGAGNGSGSGPDPASLAGLLAPDDKAAADPLAGLLATDAPIQPGGPDTLVSDKAPPPDVQLASMTAPRSKENIVSAESGGNPNVGYDGVDLSNAPRDPETGFPQWSGRMGPAGISHAAGKYQFQPRTWAEGARALGINDFSEKSQDAVYDWTRAKYGDAPWQASAGGARPGMMLAQYAPGGGPPAGSGAAAVASALAGAPSLVTPSTGKIPGINMTPQQLAILDAFSSLAGDTSKPFKDFLDIYYKSPEYLRQSAQETAQGQRAVTEPSDIRIAQAKAVEDRVSKQLEQVGNARLSSAPNGILVPDGQGGMKRVQATVEQAVRASNGLPVPELGIAGMYPDTRGGTTAAGQPTRPAGPLAGEPTATLPPGYQWQTSPEGKTIAQPIPNTPEAAAAQELARGKAIADRQLQVSRDAVVTAADRAEYLAKNYPRTTTGIVGSKLTGVWQPSQDMQAAIQTIEARTTLDQLQAARAASATGASGFGQLSDVEGAKLQSSIANLKQSQSQEQFLANLAIVKQNYIDAVHGPGAYKQMSDATVLKTQPPPQEYKEGQIFNYPDGSQRQLKGNEWVVIKPPTQR